MRCGYLLSVIAVLTSTVAKADDAYRLGPGDELRIDVFEQPYLSKEALVQADGKIYLPRVGGLTVDGMTLPEARDALAERLRSALELTDPETMIEIAKYRPVFVAGDVENPGAYAYVPGMTVMHALSLAGGFRKPQAADATARLETGRLIERREQLNDQLAISLARLARYEAEQNGSAKAVRPAQMLGLVTPERADQLMTLEAKAMSERKSALDGAIALFNQRRGQLNEEIVALEAQRAAKIEQVSVLQGELDAIKELLEKGLTPASRGYELRRTIIGTDADRREVEAFVARARGEISSVDQTELNTRSERQLEIISGIKDALDEIAQQRSTIAAVEAQIETATAIAEGAAGLVNPAGLEFDLPMVRHRGSTDFAAISFTDAIVPDDLIVIPQRKAKPRD